MRRNSGSAANGPFSKKEPKRPDGTPIDWSITSYAEAVTEGMCGGYVHALLVREGGDWRVRVHEICAFDVPWVMWAEQYGAPPQLFPKLD